MAHGLYVCPFLVGGYDRAPCEEEEPERLGVGHDFLDYCAYLLSSGTCHARDGSHRMGYNNGYYGSYARSVPKL